MVLIKMDILKRKKKHTYNIYRKKVQYSGNRLLAISFFFNKKQWWDGIDSLNEKENYRLVGGRSKER